MIRDQPQGADLLAEAGRTLRERVLPGLTSKARYSVLMALRAMDLAQHELRADLALERRLYQQLSQLIESGHTDKERYSVLSTNIRDGLFDASGKLHDFLLAVTAFKLRETDASKVSEDLNEMLDQLLREK